MNLTHCDICGKPISDDWWYPHITYRIVESLGADLENYDFCPKCSKMIYHKFKKIINQSKIENSKMPNVIAVPILTKETFWDKLFKKKKGE